MVFDQSQVLCLEIAASDGYERARPGVLSRVAQYNEIIHEVYGENRIALMELLQSDDAFNVDNFHLNCHGHKIVADLLTKAINSRFKPLIETAEVTTYDS